VAEQPGLYRFEGEGKSVWVPVNLDPAESRTAALLPDDLAVLGVPLTVPSSAVEASLRREQQMNNAEMESRQKLWRWFLLATLGVVLVETWLAGRTSRRTAVRAEAVS
jgi:hypothetical protein